MRCARSASQLPQAGHDGVFFRRVHEVQDFGGCADSAHFAALGALAGQHIVQHIGKFMQGGRLHAAEGGDTQHDVIAQAFVEQCQDARGAVAFQVHQYRGDDLRMLVGDELGHAGRFQPIERIDAVGVVGGIQYVFDQAGGAVGAQGLVEHGTYVVVRTQRNGHELVGFLAKFFQHGIHVGPGDLLQVGHGRTHHLHFPRAQVFENFSRGVLAQGHHENRAAVQVGINGCHFFPSMNATP